MDNKSEQAAELEEFSVEAIEMLEAAETDLLDLDKNRDFQSVYASVFRVFHSLKGAAGMFELNELQHHMHLLENILSSCQERKIFSPSEVTFFLNGVDAARKILSGVKVEFDYNPGTETPLPLSIPETPVQKEVQTVPVQKIKNATIGMVYVIDDELEILEILQGILASAEIEVKTFLNPKDALIAIKQSPPEAVISDMKMAELSGIEVLKAIKLINPDIPVIFVSGHLNKKILLESMENGAYAAIEKPFKENSIISTCLNAIKISQLTRLFNRSIDLIFYQFSDLEDFLISQEKKDIAQTLRKELQLIVDQRKQFRQIKQGQ